MRVEGVIFMTHPLHILLSLLQLHPYHPSECPFFYAQLVSEIENGFPVDVPLPCTGCVPGKDPGLNGICRRHENHLLCLAKWMSYSFDIIKLFLL